MSTIQVVYHGELRCEAIHQQSGTLIQTDAPTDNQGRGERFSPTDLVATALAACQATIMGIVARREGLDLTGARAAVEKHMSSQPPRRIVRLVVRWTLPAAIPEDRRTHLEQAARTCPVGLSLDPGIIQESSFSWS